MNKFISSIKFTLIVSLVLAISILVSFLILNPQGVDLYDSEILNIGKITGYAIGPAMGLITFLIIGILNLIRRLFKIRKINLLHIPTILIGLIPSFLFGWNLTAEPRLTSIAMVVIDFAARPVLIGTLATVLILIIVFIIQLFTKKNK